MGLSDLRVLLPLLVVASAAVVVMLTTAVRRSHLLAAAVCVAGFAAAVAAVPQASAPLPRPVTALIRLDRYAFFYMVLVLAVGGAVALLSHGYLEKRKSRPEEFYVLLLLAALGSSVLGAATHFASFFLGIEILSVSLYGLVAYAQADDARPAEAGMKYLVLGGASSAFLLFGMALIYARFGELGFAPLGAALLATDGVRDAYLLAGSALLLTGVGFKLGVVPFHLWTPDVYEAAPAPVAAFVATASKGAVFAVLLRFFVASGIYDALPVVRVLGWIAIASMIAGNLLALLQDNVKRILAYSSIAHLGYVLVAFVAGGRLGAEAATFYLLAYFVTTLGAFAVVTVVSGRERDADAIADYRGLFWRSPWLAGVFTAMLFSLAGIPLTAGFPGKFYLVTAGIGADAFGLVLVLVATSALGLYYYLRIVVALFDTASPDRIARPERASTPIPLAGNAVLAGTAALLFALGVFPSPWLGLVHAAVASMLR